MVGNKGGETCPFALFAPSAFADSLVNQYNARLSGFRWELVF